MLKQLAPLLPYAKRYRRRIAAGLGLVLFSNIFSLAWPYLLKLGIDDMEAGTTAARLAGYAGAIVLFSMIGGFGRFLIRELLNGMSRLVENDLRDDYFAHLLRLAPDFYGSVPTGELMSRATNDIPAVRMVIGPAIMYLVNTAVVAAIALTMLILIDLRLTMLAIIPLLAVPAVTIYFGREIHKRFEAIQAQFGRISTMAQENLAGARIVRAYVQEESQAGAFAGLNREYMIRNLRLAKVWGLFHPMLMMLTGLGAVIVLGVGGRDVIMGRISVGDFVAFVFYLMQLIIQEIMTATPSIRDADQPIPVVEPLGAIEFRNVSFRYPGTERLVLRDVSFSIEPGQTVAIVGRTGSGKSSIARLIPRLYDPDEGTITLDGVPLDRVPLDQLRSLIAVVPQEPFLFSETLGSNIAFGLQDGDNQARVEEAAEIAQLAETIGDFPGRYDTQLGERGINLSGGQKQRATLARALTRESPVLILDDALSSVDTHTEAAILDGLKDVFRRHTSIIVSHRVSAVKNADLILVIEAGEIVERGRHGQLLARDGIYAKLLERQLLEESLEADLAG
jgi:ATP-binding cassette subfamily B protein